MSAPFLAIIQQGMTRYIMPIMITVANLSNILSIIIFSRRHHRKSSCSIYLSFAAASAIVSVNWALIPGIKALNNPPDVFSQFLVLCRLRGYILQVANNLFRTFLVLACADRSAMSSSHVSIRSWATTKIAWRTVIVVIIAWLCIPSHLLIWETIENSKCSAFGTYVTFYTTYTFIIIFTPLCLISLFGFLTLRNMKRLRRRVQSVNGQPTITQGQMKKRDSDFVKMILAEVFVYLILTSAYPIVFLYTTVTANTLNKSATRLQIESFISFFSNSFLQYLNSGASFFIYMPTCHAFRSEVKQFILTGGRSSVIDSSIPRITTQRELVQRKTTQNIS
ncbi:unnamed protein product [Adineta steineri]|uniref:G-protein coupled receptors family 1 profile domain-containing protein n=1 Tax=Adineta steineri TaxID=433720 RepID=A0A819QVF5_9BILA|nr:unnamed protein product [Adineta steineri]CAF4035618.1 unnamed protein product [Adineta steineri]